MKVKHMSKKVDFSWAPGQCGLDANKVYANPQQFLDILEDVANEKKQELNETIEEVTSEMNGTDLVKADFYIAKTLDHPFPEEKYSHVSPKLLNSFLACLEAIDNGEDGVSEALDYLINYIEASLNGENIDFNGSI